MDRQPEPENWTRKTLIYRQFKIQNKATYRGESAMGKVSSEGPRCCFHWGQKSRLPKSPEIPENAEILEILENAEIPRFIKRALAWGPEK
jgi:hypothetical protein